MNIAFVKTHLTLPASGPSGLLASRLTKVISSPLDMTTLQRNKSEISTLAMMSVSPQLHILLLLDDSKRATV